MYEKNAYIYMYTQVIYIASLWVLGHMIYEPHVDILNRLGQTEITPCGRSYRFEKYVETSRKN